MVFNEDLLEKRQKLIDSGVNPYPYSFEISHTISKIREIATEWMEKPVAVAGRITALRQQGKKVFFADIEDFDNRIQIYLKQSDLSEEEWNTVLLLDIGDWVGIRGLLFATKTGELTIWTKDSKESEAEDSPIIKGIEILAKAVIRVPISKEKGDKKYYQLSDPEMLYRQRYLQWITEKKAREVMVQRAHIISSIRRFMESRGFLEVTTPTLEMIYGGASARPFETTVAALSNEKAYMRISPELQLKKFIVGGFPKVFSICQNFRNEGIDRSHNPEFTMMEWYEAFTDYNYQMVQFETLVSSLVKEIHGSYKMTYQGTELDFSMPWKRVTIIDGLKEFANCDVNAMTDEELIARIKEADPEYKVPEPFSRGHVINALFEALCEEHLVQPTFVMDHPLAISPLTKKKRGNPELVERFEPYVMRMEIGNAYSELTDPVEQFGRLQAQRQYDGQAIEEDGVPHYPVDMDFVKAISLGMPPTGGVGIGLDRIIMLLTDQPCIRDVIAFPLMKKIDIPMETESKETESKES